MTSNSNVPFVVLLSHDSFAIDMWKFSIDKEGNPYVDGVYYDGMIEKLYQMGYYKKYRGSNYVFIKEDDKVISEVEVSMIKETFFNTAIEAIDTNVKDMHVKISGKRLREEYLNRHKFVFDKQFLEHLPNHEGEILRDTKDKAYFCFKNTIVEVDKNGPTLVPYSSLLGKWVWEDQIIDRDIELATDVTNSHFLRFIFNVCNQEDDRIFSMFSAIGYLLHNHSSPTLGQAVIAYDEELSDRDNPMGGTGKGLFANALKQIRSVVKIDGKKFDSSDRFRYQDVSESTQIVWLDDIKPNFSFSTFHSVLTDGWSVEQKYKGQFFIDPNDSPKLYLCSNSILTGGGTTNVRRQHIIEFSNHYSRQIKKGNEEPIKTEHGCIFFDDWNSQEWNMFYTFMLMCVTHYLKEGLMTYEHRGLKKNTLLQATSEDFYTWTAEQEFITNVWYGTKKLYELFIKLCYGGKADLQQRGFTNWLRIYASCNGWELKTKASNSIQLFSFAAKHQ